MTTVRHFQRRIITLWQLTNAASRATVTLSVSAAGASPLSYQWRLEGNPVSGATASNLVLNSVQSSNAGNYTVVVSNQNGSITSGVARVELFTGAITTDLVAHLKFDNNLTDSSGTGNNGTSVGSTPFVTGKIGSGINYSSMANGSSFNYVTLGAPANLSFSTNVDFSIAYWAKITNWTGDPAFVATKNWNSGGNPGWVASTATDGRIQWNLAGSPGTRKDYDSPGGVFTDGTWHHIAITFDRDGNAVTYVDGNAINSTSLTASQNNLDIPGTNRFNIGQDGTGTYTDGGSVGIATGNLDDLGVWRRVLTPQEVAAIYAAGNSGNDLSTVSVSGPRLTIARQGTSVVISWPSGPGVRLQKKDTIMSTTWVDVAGSAATNRVTVPASGTSGFFRLVQ